VGFGKYGFLAREYLDVYPGHGEYGEWRRRIDGIEAFAKYLTPVHNYIYNNVYVGDAVEVLARLQTRYELILLIDVLEHFDTARGQQLLRLCQEKGDNLVISTPIDIGEQGAHFHNTLETHRSQWRPRDFNFLPSRFFISNESSFICVAGDQASSIAVRYERQQVRSALKTLFPIVRAPYRLLKRLAGNRLPRSRGIRILGPNG